MDVDQTNVLDHHNIFGSLCHCANSLEGDRVMEVEELGY